MSSPLNGMTEPIIKYNEELLQAILVPGKRRSTIEKITAKISASEQEDQCIRAYNRDFLYSMRDLGVIIDEELRPVDKQQIVNIGIAKTDEEKLENFLKVLKAGDPANGRSKQEEQENWARWTEKSLIDRALFIIEELSPITEELLTKEFLSLKVHESPNLVRIVAVLFDAAIEQHGRQAVLARLCAKQVNEELSVSINVSFFRNSLLISAQEQFMDRNVLEEKRRAIEAEMDEEKKNAMKTEQLETENAIRRKKGGSALFIGHLFLQDQISYRILHFVLCDLLKPISEAPIALDEEVIELAVDLTALVGRKVHEQETAAARAAAERAAMARWAAGVVITQPARASHFSSILETLEVARTIVSCRLRKKIDRLIALRDDGWVASA